jgi:hypothetical protein
VKSALPYIVAAFGVAVGLLGISPAIQNIVGGGKAKAVIKAPTYFAQGPVILDGHDSTGQAWVWEVNSPWAPVDQGCCAAVNICTPGVYTAKLTVKSGGRRYSESTAVHTFQVGGSPPPGPVPPQPIPPGPQPVPPGPTPPPPAPMTGLTKAAYDAVVTTVPASPDRATKCKLVASQLRDVTDRIRSTTRPDRLGGLVEAAGAMIEAYDKALGPDAPKYNAAQQQIRKAMAAVLKRNTPLAEIADAIDAVAAGLELVP